MDNLKEFKAFLKTIPSIKEDVLNHRYTWQEIYEIYTMYGEDDHFFRPYKEHPIENMNVLEVFFISQGIYIYLSILLRIFGKKEFSQLNVFDFVVFLIIAEIMTDSLGNDDFPFWYVTLCHYPEKYDDLLDEIHQKKQSTVLEKLERISILMSMLEMLQ